MHELFNLENKAVVITGSSRGIGKGMAKRFSEFGAKLIISSRKLEACKEVEMEIIKEGGIAFSKECNISKKNHLLRAFLGSGPGIKLIKQKAKPF